MSPLLDVVLGYDCNLKCTYCTITDPMRLRSLDPRVILREIDEAAARGWTRAAFTGGEPTIFKPLACLVRHARRRGFTEIKVASNGLRYAHGPYLDHLVEAGVNRFHVSVHGVDDAHYDRTVQLAGAAVHRRAGLENLVSRGLSPTVDLIMKNDTVPRLEEWLDGLLGIGVRSFQLWLVSLTDQNAGNVDQLPRLASLPERLTPLFERSRREGWQLVSLHTPRCFLPGYEDHVRHPGTEGVRVVTPDDQFDLTDSRLTGGHKAAGCAECVYESTCPGLRPDYVQTFGDGELVPVRREMSDGSAAG